MPRRSRRYLSGASGGCNNEEWCGVRGVVGSASMHLTRGFFFVTATSLVWSSGDAAGRRCIGLSVCLIPGVAFFSLLFLITFSLPPYAPVALRVYFVAVSFCPGDFVLTLVLHRFCEFANPSILSSLVSDCNTAVCEWMCVFLLGFTIASPFSFFHSFFHSFSQC